MEDYIVQGAIALLILKECFGFLRAHKNGANGHSGAATAGMIRDLWEWHAPNDRGRQPWKDTDDLEKAIAALRGEIRTLHVAIVSMHERQGMSFPAPVSLRVRD